MKQKESFEKFDEAWMKRCQAHREKKVPAPLLEGFSRSVEERIRREFEKKSPRLNPSTPWVRLWVPAFVLFLVFTTSFVIRATFLTKPAEVSFVTSPFALSEISIILEDIAVLRELGAWTEEDEAAVDEEAWREGVL